LVKGIVAKAGETVFADLDVLRVHVDCWVRLRTPVAVNQHPPRSDLIAIARPRPAIAAFVENIRRQVRKIRPHRPIDMDNRRARRAKPSAHGVDLCDDVRERRDIRIA